MIASSKKALIFISLGIIVGLLIIFGISFFRTPADFVKLDDGILVKVAKPYPGGASRVRLQAVSDKIIHVTAGFTDSVSASSLIAINKKNNVKWEMVQSGDQLILKTDALKA